VDSLFFFLLTSRLSNTTCFSLKRRPRLRSTSTRPSSTPRRRYTKPPSRCSCWLCCWLFTPSLSSTTGGVGLEPTAAVPRVGWAGLGWARLVCLLCCAAGGGEGRKEGKHGRAMNGKGFKLLYSRHGSLAQRSQTLLQSVPTYSAVHP